MKLYMDRIFVSQHAIDRGIERFELKHTKPSDVTKYIKKNLIRAEYIGRITDSEGNESELFVTGGMCFYLTLDLKLVKTVIKVDKVPYSPISEKVRCLVQKEYRKLDRCEKARIKRLELFKHESDCEISSLRLREYKSKSESVRMACRSRINALEIHRQQLENELLQVKTDKRQITKALLSVL